MSSVLAPEGDYGAFLCATPDGNGVLAASDDGALRVLELATGRCSRAMRGSTSGLRASAVTPNGCRALAGGEDGLLRLWDVRTGECARVLSRTHGVGVTRVAHHRPPRRRRFGPLPPGVDVVALLSAVPVRVQRRGTGNKALNVPGRAARPTLRSYRRMVLCIQTESKWPREWRRSSGRRLLDAVD